jgi:hypothetical protein
MYHTRNVQVNAIKREIATERDVNIDRAQLALNFVESERKALITNGERVASGLDSLDVLITVISLRRNIDDVDGYDPFYLTQTVARTYQLLREFREGNAESNGGEKYFGITLCNVDATPEEHGELNDLAEALHLPVFNRFVNKSATEDERNNIYEKENNDYSYCLKQSLKFKPKHVLLLEDDTVPLDSALWVIHHVMKTYMADPKENIAFVKFYHPPRFLPRALWTEVVVLGVLLSTAAVACHYLLSVPRRSEFMLRWTLWTCYFGLVLLTIGHVNISQLRHISKYFYIVDDALGCCTPAVLFPYESCLGVAQFLEMNSSNATHAKDLVLESYLKETATKALMVTPNVFKHIGMYSVVKSGVKDPYIVD